MIYQAIITHKDTGFANVKLVSAGAISDALDIVEADYPDRADYSIEITEAPGADKSVRSFTNTDWLGLAGATSWDDGTRPLISDGRRWNGRADCVVVAIADYYGVQVIVSDDTGNTVCIYNLEQPSRALATAILAGMPGTLGVSYLSSAGFTRIDR